MRSSVGLLALASGAAAAAAERCTIRRVGLELRGAALQHGSSVPLR
jgi:hypothetical protein